MHPRHSNHNLILENKLATQAINKLLVQSSNSHIMVAPLSIITIKVHLQEEAARAITEAPLIMLKKAEVVIIIIITVAATTTNLLLIIINEE